MQGPALYRIRVRGKLDPRFSEQLENMHIANFSGDKGGNESVLEGRLEDQAAFSGVMNTLYELHLPVISADCLGAIGDQ